MCRRVSSGSNSKYCGPTSQAPVSTVGRAVAKGMENRSRWVVVPGWVRILLVLGRVLQPLTERGSFDTAAEVDRLFEEDVASRGAEAASAPIGAGGRAVSV